MAESYVPPKEVRDLRSLVRHRASLVRTRTAIKNRVHALLDRYGLKHGFSVFLVSLVWSGLEALS